MLNRDIWTLHILPTLPVTDQLSLYQTSKQFASLVEASTDWNRVYQEAFDETNIFIHISPFLNYVRRYNAKVCLLGARDSKIVFPNIPVKHIASVFEGSTLALLDINGKVHGVDHSPRAPLSKIWGLTYYLYGVSANDPSQIHAWLSKTSPSLGIEFDCHSLKVSSAGYLCAALNSCGQILWWQRPHRPPNKEMEYINISIPIAVKDVVATRYGLRFVGQNGNLYKMQLLDQYLCAVPHPGVELLLAGEFTSISQTGGEFVAYGPVTCVGDDFGYEVVPVPDIYRVEKLGEEIFVLDKNWNLFLVDKTKSQGTQTTQVPGKYTEIVALESNLCALRVV